MAIHLKIEYPLTSDLVTEEDLITLKKFDKILKESMVTVMCSTSNYRWERALQYKSDRFYSLIKTLDSEVVGTYGIRILSDFSPEYLIEKIKMEQVFPPKQ